jgi:hypothetical protein
MPRNRTIYNALALYTDQVGAQVMQTGLGEVLQLSRVQTFDEDFSRNFTDINQYGNLASVDRLEVESPTVTASFSYYLTNGFNDHAIGLAAAPTSFPEANIVTAIGGLLSKVTDEKNYYLLIVDEGNDAAGFRGATSGAIAIGNAYLTSYSVNVAVGDIPTAEVEVEGLNVAVYQNTTGVSGALLPAISPSDGAKITDKFFRLPAAVSATGIPSALIPGDITFSIPNNSTMGFTETDLKVQDFTLSFDLNRTPLQKVGNRFAFSREIDFPVTATLELNAEVGDFGNGNLVDLLCNETGQNFTINMKQPGCGADKPTALSFFFRGAKLTSQSFTSAIGDNASMTASYEIQLGGIQDKVRGVFISGSYYDVCPAGTGNRPHFSTGYALTYPGGRYFTNQTGSWSFGSSTFPGLSTGTFIAAGDVRQSLTGASTIRATSWNGFTNILTGWSPNTGWLEFSPGSFISITRSGSFNGFPLNWYSTSRNPNTLSESEKSFTSSAFNTFTLLHTSGFAGTNTSWNVTGSLSTSNNSVNVQDNLIGYLPPNDKFLFLEVRAVSAQSATFAVSGSTAGSYAVTPSLDGSCAVIPANFRTSYNSTDKITEI